MPKHTAFFRFYAELNDFLPPEKRAGSRAAQGAGVPYSFSGKPSVKDSIEAMGVPHTEVDLILANGVSVDFSHGLSDGDRISVYPVFEALDISTVIRLRPTPLRTPKFVLDVHLGKLCGHLRLLGFDALILEQANDPELVRISADERRIILTRNVQLLKNSRVTHGTWVRSQNVRHQLVEVIRRFDLSESVKPFTRCLDCNGEILPVPAAEVADGVPQKVKADFTEFTRCASCRKVFWKGSHYDRMREFIDGVIAESERGRKF